MLYSQTGKLLGLLTVSHEYNHVLPFLASVGLFSAFLGIRVPEGIGRIFGKIAPAKYFPDQELVAQCMEYAKESSNCFCHGVSLPNIKPLAFCLLAYSSIKSLATSFKLFFTLAFVWWFCLEVAERGS